MIKQNHLEVMTLSSLDPNPALMVGYHAGLPIIHQILVELLEVCRLIPQSPLFESSLGEANRDFELYIAAPNVPDTGPSPKIFVDTPCSFRVAL